jgi:predicted transcriptional regulator
MLNYSRSHEIKHTLSIEEIVLNNYRIKIINLISKSPGIYFNEIRRQCKIGGGQLKWHMDLLVQYGIIVSEKSRQYIKYFIRQIDK